MMHSLYGSDRSRKRKAQIKQDTRSIGYNSPFVSIRRGRPEEFWLDEVSSFLSRYFENLRVSIYLIIEDEKDEWNLLKFYLAKISSFVGLLKFEFANPSRLGKESL